MKGLFYMSVEEKQQTSRVWMREARSDYEAALVLFKIEKYAIALFHSPSPEQG